MIPEYVVAEGQCNGEHLVQGDEGCGEDGGVAGHPEHSAHLGHGQRGDIGQYQAES